MGDDVDDWQFYHEDVGAPVDADAPVTERQTEGKAAPSKPKSRPSAAKTQDMTPIEYVASLKELGLNPSIAGPHLGISRSTSMRCAAGTHAIPPTVALLLRALVKLETWRPSAEGRPRRPRP